MGNNVLLSLCIPTCMRGDILHRVLDHTLSLNEFDQHVQLVISDNGSTDSTEIVVKEAIKKYPKKNIKFHRNDTNLGVINILTALQLGDGVYCKLLNDYVLIGNEALKKMKDTVASFVNCNTKDSCLLFIDHLRHWNYQIHDGGNIVLHNINEVVITLNNKMTWVSNTGCFREQIPELSQFNIYNDKLLPILYWTLYLCKTRKNVFINDVSYFGSINVPSSKRILTYNFFTPHIVWYYEAISHFTKLTKSHYRRDRYRLLSNFVGGSIIKFLIIREPCGYDLSGSWKLLFKYFYDIPYFYVVLTKGYCVLCKDRFRKLLKH